LQETVIGSGRRQLAHGTTDEKNPSTVPRDRKYMQCDAQKGEQKNAFNERREY